MRKNILLAAAVLCTSLVGFAYAETAMPMMTEFDKIASQGAGLSPVSNNQPIATSSGMASVGAVNPHGSIESKTGSQFSNKVMDFDNAGQIAGLNVFGSNLFSDQCNGLPQIALYNPNYLIHIGDQISVTVWGAIEYSSVSTVDSQGNVFIPKVGPVHVSDMPNKDLNAIISTALKKTYTKNVTVYANLVSAQPVQIFVSGYVDKPGLYSGMSSDSILYFLCKSGGISPTQGSYRHVDLVRNGKVISEVDLYDFLLYGTIPFSQLQQGDSVVVRAKGASIPVIGDVKSPAMYEPKDEFFNLSDLIKLSGVLPSSTYVLVEDNRGLNPHNTYLPLTDVKDRDIFGGESVTLTSDQNVKELTVSVNGAILGPHQFVVPIGTTLENIVNTMAFRSNASVDNLQLFRESVAKSQKAAIAASLNYLEQQAYTKSAMTKDGLLMQQSYAGLVSTFVEKAKQVQPKGQVIVGDAHRWKSIVLQNNDVINIPNQNQVITISGQIMAPIAINYNSDFDISDYINAVGGYTNSAETSYVLLLHENGTAERVNLGMFSNWFSFTSAVKGGDQIIVPNEGMSEALPIMATISQIVFQIAFAARVFISPV